MGDLPSDLEMAEAERDFACDLLKEKNDEIRRLRDALQAIITRPAWSVMMPSDIARAALKGEK